MYKGEAVRSIDFQAGEIRRLLPLAYQVFRFLLMEFAMDRIASFSYKNENMIREREHV